MTDTMDKTNKKKDKNLKAKLLFFLALLSFVVYFFYEDVSYQGTLFFFSREGKPKCLECKVKETMGFKKRHRFHSFHDRLSCSSCHSSSSSHLLGVNLKTLQIEALKSLGEGTSSLSPSGGSLTVKLSENKKSCQDCHLNPLAIGYGQGSFRFGLRVHDSIEFIPNKSRANTNNNIAFGQKLEDEAWIPFLKRWDLNLNENKSMKQQVLVKNRVGARPFLVEEQRRILKVGFCLLCHFDRNYNKMNILSEDYTGIKIFDEYNKSLQYYDKQPH